MYGTLLPGEARWRFLEPFVRDAGTPDEVAGTLFDTGQGYPAAVFGGTGRIVGTVFGLHDPERALSVLDDVEGGVAGLYRRVAVTTRSGTTVWAYAYGGGLDLVPIEGGCWSARRGAA